MTPGATYSVGGDEFGNFLIQVHVPKSGAGPSNYVRGLYGIKFTKRSATFATTDAENLRRYEEADIERKRLTKAFHDALEPLIADFYRTIWKDAFAGKRLDGEVMPESYDEYLRGPHK